MKKGFTVLCVLLLLVTAAFAEGSWKCPECGKMVPELLGDMCPYCGGAKHTHTWLPATCKTPETCAECGETRGEPAGHAWKDATCTKPKTCAVCGETEGETAPHSWDGGTVIRTADCHTEGLRQWTCTVCGLTEEDPIARDPENHTGGTETRDRSLADCTLDGYTGDTYCLGCGEKVETGKTIEALGHAWEEATCTQPRTCRTCGATEGEALGHSWDEGTVTLQADCHTEGIRQYTCTVCGETREEALPRDPENHTGGTEILNGKEKTCTEDGYTGDTYCLGCGERLETGNTVEAKGHVWKTKSTTTLRTCAVCGAADWNSLKKGHHVFFGRYPQTEEGTDDTPIEWLVLERDGNKALLLSRYALEAKSYNEERTEITWEKCSLRSWLNGEFYQRAFSGEEQEAILMTVVDNGPGQQYSKWGRYGGNHTQDKVFLLSYGEANRYLGVTRSNSGNLESMISPTAYAFRQGAMTNSDKKTVEGESACWWWLRSPGSAWQEAARVYVDGRLHSVYVNNVNGGVRPALWVDLESDFFGN